MKTILVARDFSPTPGGRENRDGPFSAEAFRARFLLPAIDNGESIVVDVDGVAGLPTSFLEEAFGGLFRVRKSLILKDVLSQIRLQTSEEDLVPLVELAKKYMEKASKISA